MDDDEPLPPFFNLLPLLPDRWVSPFFGFKAEGTEEVVAGDGEDEDESDEPSPIACPVPPALDPTGV